MKSNKVIKTLAISMIVLTAFTACDKSSPKVDNKEDATSAVEAPKGSMKIAFVEVDSIMTQYQFCKDYSALLQKKSQNIQNTLGSKQRALQSAAANFQQKVQQNAYTREQAEAINASLQRQNADLQALDQRLSGEFQEETNKYNKALRDSIKHFLAVYNKDKKYSFILSKQGDNMLYADKAYDITNEVVAGLNKAYKAKK